MGLKKERVMKRQRRVFSEAFKAEAVSAVVAGGKSAGQVAEALGVMAKSVRDWVEKAKVEQGGGGRLVAEERAELQRLRRELRTVTMERDFLKKAAAFFAKSTK